MSTSFYKYNLNRSNMVKLYKGFIVILLKGESSRAKSDAISSKNILCNTSFVKRFI